ncbi:hypothetical protein AAZX31_04G100600 [Glycine max]|uniref:Late embryogenesis abundant protein LEA-2 subgroup domain-containing protein n=2 Tax=Glycine subgen. Soja TaxID=1462606 RepID=K7KJB0_SOYBN|nr:NDR1/HIN1-like protein 13 [Glycine max]XP_028227019.1 NDR1/HIN1-like protein 13 [Glycine soja]KAG5034572.1 hypothetical protein JHK87_009482 [Glycine soja]KAG5048771.1 hypothetical protein JHK85_009874 [Glycine max]KAH1110781.1 hypothetical protein GYH30_009544 [Glycine max]KAH1253367.1 NDR1/HIN1-like protein 13 [Glycine max]KRH62371.1 hypothetical protein GLYMA_04G103700v4 [Glycine max]|eukprot:XP_003523826.1 NDR1/HIN1-like protein 13 [Glycine max]
MEERVLLPSPPPPPPPLEKKHSTNKLELPDFNPGTYVVQVPKDQVYRVPPPENARIAESHKKAPPKAAKTSRCCLFCVLFFIIFFVLLILLGAVLGGLFSMLLTPKDPQFSITRFKVVETKPHPKYDVTLEVHNLNSDVGVSYKNKGHVSLSLRRQEVASGAYPSFNQDAHDRTTFGVTLTSSKVGLPKEVEESVTNDKKKVNVTFSLAIHALARMKMGLLRSGTMKFDVTCNVKLDTLAKTTQVLSQQCETKRH